MTRREKGGEHGSLQRSFQVKAKRKVAAKGEAWAGQLCCVCLICLLLEGGCVNQCAEGEGEVLQVK